MVLTVMLVTKYKARVIDVKGAFLKGVFKNNKEIYITRDLKSTIPMTLHGYVS